MALIAVGGLAPDIHAQECKTVSAHTYTDSVCIRFGQSKWNLDMNLGDNAACLNDIDRRLTSVINDSVYHIRHVDIIGGASPEGSADFNRFLSERRANTLFNRLEQYSPLSKTDKTFTFLGRDWEGVLRLAVTDKNLPYRTETLALLKSIVTEKQSTGMEPRNGLAQLKNLRNGVPYRYLYSHIFPSVRASKVIIGYARMPSSVITTVTDTVVRTDTVYVPTIHIVRDTIYAYDCPECKPFYMAVKTNIIQDIMALPNVGVEFYLGKNLSVGSDWLYGWWSHNSRHRYWRAYGGDIYGRWWFGKAAGTKPLNGHHVGIYAQMFTYDFEWGKRGQMGGKPGGDIWDKANYGAGIEYGYSLPVARRINIDFSVGIGYVGGSYHEYLPIDGCYVWQSTKRRNYFGPTRLEVSLVWLIGCKNTNRKGDWK